MTNECSGFENVTNRDLIFEKKWLPIPLNFLGKPDLISKCSSIMILHIGQIGRLAISYLHHKTKTNK